MTLLPKSRYSIWLYFWFYNFCKFNKALSQVSGIWCTLHLRDFISKLKLLNSNIHFILKNRKVFIYLDSFSSREELRWRQQLLLEAILFRHKTQSVININPFSHERLVHVLNHSFFLFEKKIFLLKHMLILCQLERNWHQSSNFCLKMIVFIMKQNSIKKTSKSLYVNHN